MIKNKKFIAEGLLIIFSVLFALFIDKMYDDHLVREKRDIALESVIKEIKNNQLILTEWRQRHGEVKDRIDAILSGDSADIRVQLEASSFLELGLLTNQQSLADSMLSATAWESAKSSGIIAEFEFEKTRLLTDVYDLQEIITQRTFIQLVDLYFQGDTHNIANLDATLIQFKLRFGELTSQEWKLEQLYRGALQSLAADEDHHILPPREPNT